MMRLKPWQWLVLVMPIAVIVIFLLVASGWQIHRWGINWIWGIFILLLAGWRWLLVKWTQPAISEIENAIAEANPELTLPNFDPDTDSDTLQQSQTALQTILQTAKDDLPPWEDWQIFWQRCQELVAVIAQIYNPEVKRPLLNIYIPQAYGLVRGTVDEMDRFIANLSPTLNQVSIGQAYEAYEVYQKLQPSARKLWRVWNLSQWILNPVAAAARKASQPTNNRANQQLLANLGSLLREAALRNLCQQAIALYGGKAATLPEAKTTATLPQVQTQTLKEILSEAESTAEVAAKPVNLLLVGRTGAGKSSLINTLFKADLAEVDVLPSTDKITSYQWQTETSDSLTLWDTPGYEQANRDDLRELVLDYATTADFLLLVTPALDPALQMDLDFLTQIKSLVADLPAIAIITQVDRLRPIREWNPPYNWQSGDLPKEKSIREATQYRAELLGDYCDLFLPLVTADKTTTQRHPWGMEALSLALIENIAPAKQLRIARFLQDLEARSIAAAKIIDRYTFQMTTTQGITTFLKSPVLQFLATMTTGSSALAFILAEQIPVEQLPVVIGKLQMAYDLFMLLSDDPDLRNFDLLSLWSLLLKNDATPDRNAWAFGHALVEYWTKNLSVEQVRERYQYYLSIQNTI